MMQQTTNQQTSTEAPAPEQQRGPVETVRSGPIGASIWQEKSESGKEYLAITLSRSFKTNDAEPFKYSHKYFSRNRADLHDAIDKACDIVEALERKSSSVQEPKS